MYTFTSTKGLVARIFLVVLTLGCSKSNDNSNAPTPITSTSQITCQISKISSDNGEYELYKFDNMGRVSSFQLFHYDGYLTLPTTAPTTTLTYNAQGLLDRVTDQGGSYEQYSYTNGVLSSIQLVSNGKVNFQYDITTNTNKQITAMKLTSKNEAYYPAKDYNYTTTYTLDNQGHYTQVDATSAKGLFSRITRTTFDPIVKLYRSGFAGWPFDVTSSFLEYGTAFPITSLTAPLGETDYWGYDNSGNYVGLQKTFEGTFAYKANSNNFVTQSSYTNTVDKSSGTTTYQYSNCP